MAIALSGLGLLCLILAAGHAVRGNARPRPTLTGVVLGAALVRLPGLLSSLPYFSYVDEGHVLGPATRMIATRSLDPGWWRYGSFLPQTTALTSSLYGWIPGAPTINPGAATLASPYYDISATPAVILTGRLIVLLLGLLLVAAVAWLGWQVAGPLAGTAAGITAALLPALVERSQIVIVHTPAAAFVALAAAASWKAMQHGSRPSWPALAGVAAGCAFTSMYVAGSIALLVAVSALAGGHDGADRLRRLATSGLSAVGAAVLTMPAWVFAPGRVVADIEAQEAIYARRVTSTSHIDAFVMPTEIGMVVAMLGLIGIVACLADRLPLPHPRRTRVFVGTWLVTAVVHVAFLARYEYQPPRTLLPVAVFVVMAAGLGTVAIARRSRAAVAVALALVGFVAVVPGGLADRALHDPHRTDTREVAVDHVRSLVRGQDTVVVLEELAILPWELERIQANVVVVPLDAFSPELAAAADVIVTGDLSEMDETSALTVQQRLEGWELAKSFGTRAIPEPRGYWRTNDLRVEVRRP